MEKGNGEEWTRRRRVVLRGSLSPQFDEKAIEDGEVGGEADQDSEGLKIRMVQGWVSLRS